MYRDDLEAAHAQAQALEAQLASLKRQIAERESGAACSVPEHAKLVERIRQLSARLEREKASGAKGPTGLHADKEQQLRDLRNEMNDLELLAEGDAALLEKTKACEVAIAKLEQTRAAVGEHTELVLMSNDGKSIWAPARPTSSLLRQLLAVTPLAVPIGVALTFVGGYWLSPVVAIWCVGLGAIGAICSYRLLREQGLVRVATMGALPSGDT